MKAPLIFCSTSHSINVQKIFKIVLSKVGDVALTSATEVADAECPDFQAFDLKCTIPEITETGEPLLIYVET